VFGFLFGYTKEEGIDSGARFFLLDLAHSFRRLENIPLLAYMIFCGLVLGAISLWAWRYASVERIAFQRPGSLQGPGSESGRWPAKRGLAWPAAPLLQCERSAYPAPAYLRAAMMLAFAMMLLFSPHYPWYIAWLVPFFVLVPTFPLLTYIMAFFYLFTTALANPGPKMFLLNKILYGAVAVAFLLNWLIGRLTATRFAATTQTYEARSAAETERGY
jgi:hypothetical protein